MYRLALFIRKHLKPLAGCFFILLGTLLSGWYIAVDGHQHKNQLLIANANASAQLLNQELINELVQLPPEQLADHPAYRHLREQLITIGDRIPSARFVYLMVQRTDGIHLLIDSQPSRFQDTYPDAVGNPDEFYADTDPDYSLASQQNTPVLIKGTVDKWGKFNSALMAIRQPDSDEVIAVIGIDITTTDWLIDDLNRQLPLLVITVILLVGCGAASRIKKQNLAFKERLVITQHTVDKASQPIIWADAEGLVAYANESAKRYTLNRQPINNRSLWQLYGLFSASQWKQRWQQLQNKQQVHVISQLGSHNGAVSRFELRLTKIEYKHREYAIIFAYDISDQVLAVKQRRDNEELYRLLFNKMPSAFVYGQVIEDQQAQPDFIFLEANKNYEKHTGSTLEKIIGRRYSEVFGADQKVAINWPQTFSEVVKKGGSKELEAFFEPLGKTFKVIIYAETGGRFVCIFKDISDRQRSDQALERSQQRLKTLFESFPDILLIFDQSYKIIKANPATAKQLDVNLEKLIDYDLRKFITPSSLNKLTELQNSLDLNTPNIKDIDLINRQGKIVPCEINAKSIEHEGQKLVLASLRNLSEQQQRESELQTANAQLRKMQVYSNDRELRLLELQKLIADKKRLLFG